MTEPDSPHPDKGLGGREARTPMRQQKGEKPAPSAGNRAAGTTRPSFWSGQMNQAASSGRIWSPHHPLPQTVLQTVTATIPEPHRGPKAGWDLTLLA